MRKSKRERERKRENLPYNKFYYRAVKKREEKKKTTNSTVVFRTWIFPPPALELRVAYALFQSHRKEEEDKSPSFFGVALFH